MFSGSNWQAQSELGRRHEAPPITFGRLVRWIVFGVQGNR
jgi:hypothetical protein